jgi:CheY-like chemotaxis protein
MRGEQGHLVLCVDDEEIGLGVRRTILERAGYHVLTACDGTEGLEIFAREPVEAVILDYSMPGMHGDEDAPEEAAIPILLLSAYIGVPGEVTSAVSLSMMKGEGAELMLDKLRSLLEGEAPH